MLQPEKNKDDNGRFLKNRQAAMRRLSPVVSIRTILPNLVTLFAFAMGLTGIKLAIVGKFEAALTVLALAGVLDGLDGTVARLLKSTSRFGAELDSLSDVVAFGVAPAVLVYLWALQSFGRLGWVVAIIYAMAMALRLARFNAQIDDEQDPKKKLGFFTGTPAPVGAALMVFPLFLDFSFSEGFWQAHPVFILMNSIIVSLFLVSTLPTPSLKKLRVERRWFPLLLLVMGAVIAGLLAEPWHMASLLCLSYFVSLPFCYWFYRQRLEKKGWQEAD